MVQAQHPQVVASSPTSWNSASTGPSSSYGPTCRTWARATVTRRASAPSVSAIACAVSRVGTIGDVTAAATPPTVASFVATFISAAMNAPARRASSRPSSVSPGPPTPLPLNRLPTVIGVRPS